VDLLIRHGASVVTRDNSGLTPLHWAVVKGNKMCIKHLVLAGADLDAKESEGKTPRDMAEELKGGIPYTAGLKEAGWSPEGRRIVGRFDQVGVILYIGDSLTDVADNREDHTGITDLFLGTDIQDIRCFANIHQLASCCVRVLRHAPGEYTSFQSMLCQ
jgi:hypothetical protein